ncbi:DUF484 family protein [Celerinatantimonas sp. YJH-8]|uniref:DUF484 family protein n=1 Tax=Celerinatantimonas sp. YJH-8 TaxID=3228714 RepID=UPI0038C8F1EB
MSVSNLKTELLDDEQVAEYLQHQPDFFNRYPQLATQLRIPHPQRGTVSLVELNLSRLRDKVQTLESEITDLMAVASHNERIFRVYVDLLPLLMRSQSLAELEMHLHHALVEQLGVTTWSLRLNRDHLSLAKSFWDRSLSGDQIENIRVTRLSHAEHYFGRLTRGERELLFDAPHQANSVAMIPLGPQARLGLFVAASLNADHYVAGMDSLLLGQLCDVIATLLPALVNDVAA